MGWPALTRAAPRGVATARAEAVRLAKRVRALNDNLVANQAQLQSLIEESKAAPLLEKIGIGPLVAAVVYAAWTTAAAVHRRPGTVTTRRRRVHALPSRGLGR